MVGLILLAIAPVFCSLLVAPSASALSLPGIINDITAPVTDVLAKKSTPAHPTPTATPAPGEGHQAAPPASNAASPTTDMSADAAQPVEYGEPLDPMPVYTQRPQYVNVPSHYTVQPAAAHNLRTTQDSSLAFLQPSEQGWKIFGTPWYLWALAGAAIATGWWWTAVHKAKYLYLSLFSRNSL
jgi:hypothetical protein